MISINSEKTRKTRLWRSVALFYEGGRQSCHKNGATSAGPLMHLWVKYSAKGLPGEGRGLSRILQTPGGVEGSFQGLLGFVPALGG